MTELEKAARQALEALEKNHYYMIDAGLPNQSMLNANFAAITALRQALAEEQKPAEGRDWSLLEATQESLREHMAEIKRLRELLEQQAAGEPVATWENKYGMKEWQVHALRAGWSLPASKPWVGLTDEEKADLFEGTAPCYNEVDYADAIEAKLKEKNNG